MEFIGTYQLEGTRQEVWAALNVPERLQHIIPGCTAIDEIGAQSYRARVTTRVGPLKVNFVGTINFVDLVPFDSFSVEGQGEGGPAGFARGRVDITLKEISPQATLLAYRAHSEVGGKLAALGGRLLEAISRRNIELFFAGMQQELSGATPVTPARQAADQHGRVMKPQLAFLPVLNTLLLATITVAVWIIALK